MNDVAKHDQGPPWWTAFLKAYAIRGVISRACQDAGTHRSTLYRMLEDPDRKAEFEQAEQEYRESLEAEATQRARDGVLELVVANGLPVFVGVDEAGDYVHDPALTVKFVPLMRRRCSDALLIFLLKNRCGYLEKTASEISGPSGGPIQTEAKVEHSGKLSLQDSVERYRQELMNDDDMESTEIGQNATISPGEKDTQ